MEYCNLSKNENRFDDRDIIIWGMGIGGINRYRELLSTNNFFSNRIVGFTDSMAIEKTEELFCGKKIYSLGEIENNKEKYSIIVATKIRQYIAEIFEKLKQMDINDHVYTFTSPFKPKFNVELLNENDTKIKAVLDLLQDDKSKDVFNNLLAYRKDYKLSWLSNSVDGGEAQYFAPFIDLSHQEVFIDCGAYSGDTIDAFINHTNGCYKKIYAFEPDLQLYEIMNSFIAMKSYCNVKTYQKGVMDKNAILRFNASASAGSAVSMNGSQVIETVRLDDALYDIEEKITYVKMDIEGVESEALNGMRKIIERDKPKLAICIYHKEADLWELPLQIKEMNSSYKLYIRHYLRDSHCETVCYAI